MTRTSNNTVKYTTLGLLATLAATVSSPVLADRQSDKNNLRNLAIAGAAVAGYGLFTHNNTVTILGTAGAAVAGSQYEKDRKQQSQDNGYYSGGRYDGQGDGRRYHRTDNNGYSGNRGGYYTNDGRYNDDGSQWRNDHDSNRDRDSNRDHDSNRDWTSRSDDRSRGGDQNRDGWNGDARRDDGQRRVRTDRRDDRR